MPVNLRDYQIDAINRIRSLMQRGCKTVCYVAPTGSGKTALTAHMLKESATRGMRSIFIVHRRELIKQSCEAFEKEGIEYGIISAGTKESINKRVQIASVQTLARRLSRAIQPTLVVWDEAHHLASESWASVFRCYSSSFHVGLTATPERLDGRGLNSFFRGMVVGPSTSDLIAKGFLSPYRLFAPTQISVQGIHTRMGDFDKKELQRRIDRPSITGDVISHYLRLCNGKRAIVFCAGIDHSKNVAEQFNAVGIKAAHVDGGTSEEERDNAIAEFKDGNIKVLCNVELFGEGFNVPSIEVAILLRATQSRSLYLQQVGRGLRPSGGKSETFILDHVGNWERHGLPDDQHEWSLNGRAHKVASAATPIKLCSRCFGAQRTFNACCEFCGEIFISQKREISQKEGELEEIHQEAIKKQFRTEQGQAQTEQDLYKLGVSRGYKNPRAWAHFVYQGRLNKRFRP